MTIGGGLHNILSSVVAGIVGAHFAWLTSPLAPAVHVVAHCGTPEGAAVVGTTGGVLRVAAGAAVRRRPRRGAFDRVRSLVLVPPPLGRRRRRSGASRRFLHGVALTRASRAWLGTAAVAAEPTGDSGVRV